MTPSQSSILIYSLPSQFFSSFFLIWVGVRSFFHYFSWLLSFCFEFSVFHLVLPISIFSFLLFSYFPPVLLSFLYRITLFLPLVVIYFCSPSSLPLFLPVLSTSLSSYPCSPIFFSRSSLNCLLSSSFLLFYVLLSFPHSPTQRY